MTNNDIETETALMITDALIDSTDGVVKAIVTWCNEYDDSHTVNITIDRCWCRPSVGADDDVWFISGEVTTNDTCDSDDCACGVDSERIDIAVENIDHIEFATGTEAAMRELVAFGDEIGMTGAELVTLMWCDDLATIVKHGVERRRARDIIAAHGDPLTVLRELTLMVDNTDDMYND
jgi:hypothetical protein